jgi:peptidoglycan/LPS O-acetylase OafA/YrhL
VRRFFRIYPPYALAVLLFALVFPWTRIDFSFSGALQLGSHLALIHNFTSPTFYGLSPAFWSIAVEVQLYLLYPILLALVSRFGWKRSLIYIGALEIVLRGIWGVSMICRGTVPLWFTGLPFVYWFSWSVGAAIADAYLSGRSLPFANQSLLIWGVLILGSTTFKPLVSFSFLFFALLTATAIAKLLRQRRAAHGSPGFFSKYLATIGVWSYSIYLLHSPCLLMIPTQFGLDHPLLKFLLGLGLWLPIMVCSGLWFKFLECPGIDLGKRLIRKNSDRERALRPQLDPHQMKWGGVVWNKATPGWGRAVRGQGADWNEGEKAVPKNSTPPSVQ